MRTNTRVEFGLYDVTARGDSAPSCTTAKPFAIWAVTCCWKAYRAKTNTAHWKASSGSWMAAFPSSRRCPSSISGGFGAPRRATRSACLPTRLCWTSHSRKTTAAAASRCILQPDRGLGQPHQNPVVQPRRRAYLYGAFLPGLGGLLLRQEGRELPPYSHSFS